MTQVQVKGICYPLSLTQYQQCLLKHPRPKGELGYCDMHDSFLKVALAQVEADFRFFKSRFPDVEYILQNKLNFYTHFRTMTLILGNRLNTISVLIAFRPSAKFHHTLFPELSWDAEIRHLILE